MRPYVLQPVPDLTVPPRPAKEQVDSRPKPPSALDAMLQQIQDTDSYLELVGDPKARPPGTLPGLTSPILSPRAPAARPAADGSSRPAAAAYSAIPERVYARDNGGNMLFPKEEPGREDQPVYLREALNSLLREELNPAGLKKAFFDELGYLPEDDDGGAEQIHRMTTQETVAVADRSLSHAEGTLDRMENAVEAADTTLRELSRQLGASNSGCANHAEVVQQVRATWHDVWVQGRVVSRAARTVAGVALSKAKATLLELEAEITSLKLQVQAERERSFGLQGQVRRLELDGGARRSTQLQKLVPAIDYVVLSSGDSTLIGHHAQHLSAERDECVVTVGELGKSQLYYVPAVLGASKYQFRLLPQGLEDVLLRVQVFALDSPPWEDIFAVEELTPEMDQLQLSVAARRDQKDSGYLVMVSAMPTALEVDTDEDSDEEMLDQGQDDSGSALAPLWGVWLWESGEFVAPTFLHVLGTGDWTVRTGGGKLFSGKQVSLRSVGTEVQFGFSMDDEFRWFSVNSAGILIEDSGATRMTPVESNRRGAPMRFGPHGLHCGRRIHRRSKLSFYCGLRGDRICRDCRRQKQYREGDRIFCPDRGLGTIVDGTKEVRGSIGGGDTLRSGSTGVRFDDTGIVEDLPGGIRKARSARRLATASYGISASTTTRRETRRVTVASGATKEHAERRATTATGTQSEITAILAPSTAPHPTPNLGDFQQFFRTPASGFTLWPLTTCIDLTWFLWSERVLQRRVDVAGTQAQRAGRRSQRPTEAQGSLVTLTYHFFLRRFSVSAIAHRSLASFIRSLHEHRGAVAVESTGMLNLFARVVGLQTQEPKYLRADLEAFVCSVLDAFYGLGNLQPQGVNDGLRPLPAAHAKAVAAAVFGLGDEKREHVENVLFEIEEFGEAGIHVDRLVVVMVQEWEVFQASVMEAIIKVLNREKDVFGFVDFANVAQALSVTRASWRDMAQCFHEGLDRSGSDFEVTGKALASMVNGYPLLQMGTAGPVMKDPDGSGRVPETLDAAILQIAYTGLHGWVQADAVPNTGPSAADSSVSAAFRPGGGVSFHGASDDGTSIRLIGSALESVGRQVAAVAGKVDANVKQNRKNQGNGPELAAVWQALDEAARMWMVEWQTRQQTSATKQVSASTAHLRIRDAAAGFLDTVSSAVVECVGSDGIGDLLAGPSRQRLEELRGRMEGVVQFAQGVVTPGMQQK